MSKYNIGGIDEAVSAQYTGDPGDDSSLFDILKSMLLRRIVADVKRESAMVIQLQNAEYNNNNIKVTTTEANMELMPHINTNKPINRTCSLDLSFGIANISTRSNKVAPKSPPDGLIGTFTIIGEKFLISNDMVATALPINLVEHLREIVPTHKEFGPSFKCTLHEAAAYVDDPRLKHDSWYRETMSFEDSIEYYT